MDATCGDCGSPMRQTYAFLTAASGCTRMPLGLECSNDDCRARALEQDRADAKARDEAAIARAVESGLLAPDDATEEEKYV